MRHEEAPDAGYKNAEPLEAGFEQKEGSDAEGLVKGYVGNVDDVKNGQDETKNTVHDLISGN